MKDYNKIKNIIINILHKSKGLTIREVRDKLNTFFPKIHHSTVKKYLLKIESEGLIVHYKVGCYYMFVKV